MRTLGILFYNFILVLIGILMMVFAVVFTFPKLQPQCITFINDLLIYTQNNPNTRIIIFLSGILLILISFSLAQLILSRFQREKTIAFTTSSGQVTIALSAVEDLIRRVGNVIPEIKELRPDVWAAKKDTIIADLRVVLKSESNIPELTSRLQELTRLKLQEVLGIEGEIIVKIHIAKIISAEEKDRKKKDFESETPNIPFRGYGRA